jgi:predicted nucleic acid-binding Zn ribbon protein
MRHRRAPRSLSFALANVTAGLEPATGVARVQGCWAEAVGGPVAKVSRPVSEQEGVVTVACEDAMWANELELMAPDLLERVYAALGDRPLRQLRFKAGDFRALL